MQEKALTDINARLMKYFAGTESEKEEKTEKEKVIERENGLCQREKECVVLKKTLERLVTSVKWAEMGQTGK